MADPAPTTAFSMERSEAIGIARFQAMLEETLFPPPHTVEFVRTAQNDYTLRFGATRPHIAELFQENTKLTPYATLQPPADGRELNQARAWYFATAYRMRDKDLEPGQEHNVRIRHSDLPRPLANVFHPFAQAGHTSDLLYSVDLFLLYQGRLYHQVPRTDVLWLEKIVQPFEHQLLQASLLRVPRDLVSAAAGLLFVVGAPWRYMMFFGPRGYRRMMFEAGELMAELRRTATVQGLAATLCQDFYDARVDRVLLLDGTERTTLAVIALHDREQQERHT